MTDEVVGSEDFVDKERLENPYDYHAMKNITLKQLSGRKIKLRKLLAEYVDKLQKLDVGRRESNRKILISAFNNGGMVSLHDAYLKQINDEKKRMNERLKQS